MKDQEWTFDDIDRSEWGPGEWDGEPDKAQWTDPETGLPCLAVRHDRSGHWCGYVGVPGDHPILSAPATDWGDNAVQELPCHGGVTYGPSPCQEDAERGVCHLTSDPTDFEPAHWIGFDCAHSGDVSPGTRRYSAFRMGESYRPLAYVKRECAGLAGAIVKAAQ